MVKMVKTKWLDPATLENTSQKVQTKIKNLIIGVCMGIIVVGVCYVILSPLIGIAANSFMSPRDITNPMVFLIPNEATTEHYMYASRHMNYISGDGVTFGIPFTEIGIELFAGTILSGTLIRTLVYSLLFALLNVGITSMVGYGFARFDFYGRNFLFAMMILTIVVPVQVYIVPMFINFRFFLGMDFNILGSHMPLFFLTITGMGLSSGLYIYIFRQFFRGMPKEIEEAAFIDGAGLFGTFTKVMMPNATPAIITVLLFAFVWHYNDTFYSSMLNPGNNLMAAMVGGVGAVFANVEHVNDPALEQLVVFAGVVLAILPILLIYLFLQRYFIEGLERSGIVG
ncbi:MAG: carbohydrate ABC transporter permease [Defluviitaleaceae bacterium]|nr:carbohydrate ABC transporter permease [Defluviitaleaceae bacterium]